MTLSLLVVVGGGKLMPLISGIEGVDVLLLTT
ncbi:hypothetical protein J2Y41_004052 [Arthrobacter sp. 1088]|nr:hypothetical protein [Arthrobacter sp. 1088]